MNFIRSMPRKVLISVALLLLGIVLTAVLVPVLGGMSDDAALMTSRLKGEIDTTRRDITQTLADKQYVTEHQEEFEALMKSDRLVPHTRRSAVVELQKIATRNGISNLEWSFSAAPANSVTSAQNQPSSAAYRLAVEQIGLRISAPTDGAIYRFLEDLADSFPGSAVTQQVKLGRAQDITPAMMAALSKGKDAQIVTGEITVLWRTAEAQEQKGAPKK